jgi:hypothetical protein
MVGDSRVRLIAVEDLLSAATRAIEQDAEHYCARRQTRASVGVPPRERNASAQWEALGLVSEDAVVPEFMPGLELARHFYQDVVARLLDRVPHAAARMGWGSDVLRFDTERSTDHGWGPRVQLFVASGDIAEVRERIDAGLPAEFRGWPTRFGWDDTPVQDHVEVVTLAGWFEERLGFDPRAGIGLRDWLVAPQQRLLETTAGAVFHDPEGELTRLRETLAWYPDEAWVWLLGCQWQRVSQEEAFVGREAEVGDDLGSRIVTARLVRDLIRLCFLLERRYAPYSKWLGSAFRSLDAYGDVGTPLAAALAAVAYSEREAALIEATQRVAVRHNALGLTRYVSDGAQDYYGRPFRVLFARRFTEACQERVTDPWLRSLPLIGAIDQWADSSDLTDFLGVYRRATALYEPNGLTE